MIRAGLLHAALIFALFTKPMSPDQVRVIFERVAYKMVLAGWLKCYSFTAGKGHQVVWHADGAQKGLLLKELCDQFNLTKSDDLPHFFHLACKGKRTPAGIPIPVIDDEVSAFWLMCVSELSLGEDGDGRLAMVHLVTSWAPEAENTICAVC
jgi:hypothetical protein